MPTKKDNAIGLRKCQLCKGKINPGEICIQFDITLYGRHVQENVCAECMRKTSEEEFSRRMTIDQGTDA